MFDLQFIPPTPEIAQRETSRRLELIDETVPLFEEAAKAIVVTGSMAYGRDFSVTGKSDIDLQIFVTPETAEALLRTEVFDGAKLAQAVDAYQRGIVSQFSLSAWIGRVMVECDFWDLDDGIAAATLASPSTVRLRSTLEPPSIDYVFAFDGSMEEVVLPGRKEGDYIVGDFPSYHRVDGKLFLSRPVADMLAEPLVVHGEEVIAPCIDAAWQVVVRELASAASGPIDLDRFNVVNALSGKSKMSAESKEAVMERTRWECHKAGLAFLR